MTHALHEFKQKISVVIPAYNEEHRLPQTLRDVSQFLENNVSEYEIIVVDDGSRDATVKKVQQLQEFLPHLRVFQQAENQGKGAAVQRGFHEAEGDLFLFMDADHSTNIRELAKLPFLIHKADVFVSSRYLPTSDVTKSQSKLRVMVSRVANAGIRMLVPGIKDTQNGFKIYTAKAAKEILPYLTLKRWAFDVEMLFVAKKLGYRLVEFPVTWHNSDDSRLRLVRDVRNTAAEFLRLLGNIMLGKYRSNPKPNQANQAQHAKRESI